ncbi:MAG: hypothetical protein R3E39_05620 [Anaerolineae bacterium]
MNEQTTLPMMGRADEHPCMQRLNAFLDRYILPYPVKYLTNRLTILATLFLLIPLLALANVQVFVLAANSYLNVMSVVVSSTVLLYSTISEARDRSAAQRREEIANAHEAMIEKRAETDHELILGIQEELRQHINMRLDDIESSLSEKLETIQAQDRAG